MQTLPANFFKRNQRLRVCHARLEINRNILTAYNRAALHDPYPIHEMRLRCSIIGSTSLPSSLKTIEPTGAASINHEIHDICYGKK